MPNEPNGQNMEKDVQEEVTTSKTPAELPEDAKERTKVEFEKLKQHNKVLAEENEQLKAVNPPKQSVLESFDPQVNVANTSNLSQQQVDDVVKGLIDENGYLDQALLESTLRNYNQQVAEAKTIAEQARLEAFKARSEVSNFEIKRETRVAHKKFPSVDPNSNSFDPIFYKNVKNALLGAMYEGKKMSFIDACREVKKVYKPNKDVQLTKAQAVEEYKTSVAQKSALNETGSSKFSSKASKEALIEGTRRGDATSIFARLANI